MRTGVLVQTANILQTNTVHIETKHTMTHTTVFLWNTKGDCILPAALLRRHLEILAGILYALMLDKITQHTMIKQNFNTHKIIQRYNIY